MTARSTAETRKLEPTAITVFRQGDIGEYLREVGSLTSSKLELAGCVANTPNRKIPSSRLRIVHTRNHFHGVRRSMQEFVASSLFSTRLHSVIPLKKLLNIYTLISLSIKCYQPVSDIVLAFLAMQPVNRPSRASIPLLVLILNNRHALVLPMYPILFAVFSLHCKA